MKLHLILFLSIFTITCTPAQAAFPVSIFKTYSDTVKKHSWSPANSQQASNHKKSGWLGIAPVVLPLVNIGFMASIKYNNRNNVWSLFGNSVGIKTIYASWAFIAFIAMILGIINIRQKRHYRGLAIAGIWLGFLELLPVLGVLAMGVLSSR